MVVVILTMAMVSVAALLAVRSVGRVASATAAVSAHRVALLSASVDELRAETDALAAAVSSRTPR